LGVVLIAGAAGHLCADEIYKTVDAQGHVSYSDHALSPQSKRVTLDVIEADPAEAARLERERAQEHAEADQQAKLSQRRAAEQQKQDAQKQQQERKCEQARIRFAAFAAGGRIVKYDEQGNREFYSDEEIDAQRNSAKAQMDSACSN
jgi:cation transport ATPase